MNSLVRRMASMCVQNSIVPGKVSSVVSGPTASHKLHHLRATPPSWLASSSTQHMPFSTDTEREIRAPSTSSPQTSAVFSDEATGQHYGMVLDTRKLPKLKPGVVQKRMLKLKTYEGREKSIRQSPWKLNRICQLAAGLTLEEALTQLQFCDLKNSDLVAKVLKRTSNLADIRHGIQMSQLEVAECFATKSMSLQRMKPMGRGRFVLMSL